MKLDLVSKNKKATGKSKISMRVKVFSYLLLFVAVSLLLMWLFEVVFLNDFYEGIKLRELKHYANMISDNIESEDIEILSERVAKEENVCVLVYSIEQYKAEKIVSVDISRDCMIHHISGDDLHKLYQKAYKNGGTYIERIKRDAFRNTFYDVGEFKGDVPGKDNGMPESTIYVKNISVGEKEYVIMLNTNLSPINATVKTLFIQICIISAILILLAGILAFAISKHLSKPITKINNSAKLLAKGNYDVSFEGGGYREINELNDTLNYAVSELSKTDVLQKELISNISHDLRTPLTLISGYAELMRDIPKENNGENLQIIIDETARLSSLVNDLLDISRIQSGTVKINPERFNLTELIKEVLQRYNKLIESEGYTISFIYDEDIFVVADRTRMLQVIYNYINNAVNYTGEDKKVTVKQERKGENVRISVIDTGEGIPDEEIPYIWERYYKAKSAHKRASVGSGIGLSIVKGILDMHKATFGVESKVGEGSSFWFELKIMN